MAENKPKSKEQITPANCPGHEWHPHLYSAKEEQCIICKAERGKY